MSSKRRALPSNLVPHSRFGKTIRRSDYDVDDAAIRSECPKDDDEVIFPESAIPADLRRQNYMTVPRRWYVDVLKTCRNCRRRFIFYAAEQKYWYENLRIPIYAACAKCPECRKTNQTLRRRFQRFSQAVTRSDLTDDDFATLVLDAVFLWENGILQKREKLNRLRSQARRRIPNRRATREIEELLNRSD